MIKWNQDETHEMIILYQINKVVRLTYRGLGCDWPILGSNC